MGSLDESSQAKERALGELHEIAMDGPGAETTYRVLDDLNGPPQSDSFDFTVEGLLGSLTLFVKHLEPSG